MTRFDTRDTLLVYGAVCLSILSRTIVIELFLVFELTSAPNTISVSLSKVIGNPVQPVNKKVNKHTDKRRTKEELKIGSMT